MGPMTTFTSNTTYRFNSTGSTIVAGTITAGAISTSSIINLSTNSITFGTVPKRLRGWNGRHQSRCSGCARWAKALDAGTVECRRCLGEMRRW